MWICVIATPKQGKSAARIWQKWSWMGWKYRKSLAVGRVCMAINWPTLGCKGRTLSGYSTAFPVLHCRISRKKGMSKISPHCGLYEICLTSAEDSLRVESWSSPGERAKKRTRLGVELFEWREVTERNSDAWFVCMWVCKCCLCVVTYSDVSVGGWQRFSTKETNWTSSASQTWRPGRT